MSKQEKVDRIKMRKLLKLKQKQLNEDLIVRKDDTKGAKRK